tara:strand:- start:806 stop:922 length:117 start_codon:yes stop_codon:yes gene_type:complete
MSKKSKKPQSNQQLMDDILKDLSEINSYLDKLLEKQNK